MERIKFTIDLLESAVRRFTAGGLVVRANAISYSILISIVPLLTIAMRFANLNREELRFQLSSFFHLYGITGAEPLLGILDDILGRSNAIAGIGVIFMAYAALKIFSYIESTANHVYRVKPRGFLIRNSIFTSWLIIVPFAIIVTVTGLTSMQKGFNHPAIVDILEHEGKTIILRSDHSLFVDGGSEEEIPYLERTDFRVPGRLVLTDAAEGTAPEVIASTRQEVGAPLSVRAVGESIYVLAQPNFLFFSQDGGQTWDYRVFQVTSERAAVAPRLGGMVAEQGRILLLLVSGQGSRLISMDPDYMELMDVTAYPEAFQGLTRSDRYYLTARGSFRASDDGIAWGESRNIPGLTEMITLIFPAGGDGWLAMTAAGRLVRLDSMLRPTYPAPRMPASSVLKEVHLSTSGNFFAFSRDGQVRLSLDGGATWIRVDLPGIERGPGLSDLQTSSEGFWIGTEDNRLFRYRIERIRMQGGDDAPVAVGTQISKRLPGRLRPILGAILADVLAFAAINILFTLSYAILPNADVKLKAAWTGAFLTSVIVALFTVAFRQLMPFFASTGFVYGVWVALPLGLMVLLFLIQFFLFGMVVTRLVQFPRLVRRGVAVVFLERAILRLRRSSPAQGTSTPES